MRNSQKIKLFVVVILIVGSVMGAPATKAQTISDSNQQLISMLQQLIVLLTKQMEMLQQQLAMQQEAINRLNALVPQPAVVPSRAPTPQPVPPPAAPSKPITFSATIPMAPSSVATTNGGDFYTFNIIIETTSGNVFAGKQVQVNGVSYTSNNNGVILYGTYPTPYGTPVSQIVVTDGVSTYSQQVVFPMPQPAPSTHQGASA